MSLTEAIEKICLRQWNSLHNSLESLEAADGHSPGVAHLWLFESILFCVCIRFRVSKLKFSLM